MCVRFVFGRPRPFRHLRRPMATVWRLLSVTQEGGHYRPPPQSTGIPSSTEVLLITKERQLEALLCHPLGCHRLTGCAVFIHTANYVLTACDVAATARPSRRGSILSDSSKSLTGKTEESLGPFHTLTSGLAGPGEARARGPSLDWGAFPLPSAHCRLPLLFRS